MASSSQFSTSSRTPAGKAVAQTDQTLPRPPSQTTTVEHCRFDLFGHWQQPTTVARTGKVAKIAAWFACNRQYDLDTMEAWTDCQAALAECFVSYSIIRLTRPSFFLPADDVAFEVIKNPVAIPDQPPRGVRLRHSEALDQFPGATFYFLRPIFLADGSGQLCLGSTLAGEAADDREYAIFLARLYGSYFRSAHWLHGQVVSGLARSLEVATQIVKCVSVTIDEFETKTTQVQARSSRYDKASAEFLQSLDELNWHLSIDPVLCFELPNQPGELRFESHWYIGTDGKTYVHY